MIMINESHVKFFTNTSTRSISYVPFLIQVRYSTVSDFFIDSTSMVAEWTWNVGTLLANFMEQNPSGEVNSHSHSQEILRLVWNPKVHCRVHKSPPPVCILSQMHPIHTFSPCLFKVRSNIIISTFRCLGRSKESVQTQDPV